MATQITQTTSLAPFILLTDRLVIVPTPLAIHHAPYLTLYASLHADEAFCSMAFGPHFPARQWTEPQTRDVILTRDIQRCWQPRGLGDFGVALRTKRDGSTAFPTSGAKASTRTMNSDQRISIIEFDPQANPEMDPFHDEFQGLEWIAYAGVRDATTTSLPAREDGDAPLPPWEEMVEVRYGVDGAYWGKGIAGEAAGAVMGWAAGEKGVRRFIAETERGNTRSGRVLGKMGFGESGTGYWKEEGEVEWERWVGGGDVASGELGN